MEHHFRRFSVVLVIISFSCLFTLQSIYAQTTRKRRVNVPPSPQVEAQQKRTELLQQKAALETRKDRLMEGLRKLAVEYYGGAGNVAESFADLAKSSVLLAAGASESKVIKRATDLDSVNNIVAEAVEARKDWEKGDSESAHLRLAKAAVAANNFLLSHLKESELVGEIGGISEQIVDGMYGILKAAIELRQFQNKDRDKLQHEMILRLGEVNRTLRVIDQQLSKFPSTTTNNKSAGFDPSSLSPQEREGWERNQALNKPGTVGLSKNDTSVIIDPIWLISWRAEGDPAFGNKPAMKDLFYKTYPQLQQYQKIARYRSPETEVAQDLENGNLSLSNRQFDPSPLSPQEWKGRERNQESIRRKTVGANVSKGGRKRVSRKKSQAEEAIEEFLRATGELPAETPIQTEGLEPSNDASSETASTGVIFHGRPSSLGCRPSMYIVTSAKGKLILEQDGQREVIQDPENTFLSAEAVYPLVPGTYNVVELMQYDCNGMGGFWRKGASSVFTIRLGEVTHVQLP